ncbi:MAG: EamA family transporter [Candidatus Bathyarchaeota archaeon]|nr:EamA family transporter [Candidatus Bathyarchaeota archaeon]MDH5732517.1 EamA family transporter [Candidatus Bathyarchaeota archaeon]
MEEGYGYLLIAMASILWGTLGVLGEMAFQYAITPTLLIMLRLCISSFTLFFPIFIFKRELLKINRHDIFFFTIFGLFPIALQRVAYFYAVDFTTATVAAMLFYTYPAIVAAMSVFFFKKTITKKTVLAIILTFLGASFTVKIYETSSLIVNLHGILFGLLSSALFAVYVAMVKRLRNDYSSWTLVFYGDGIGAIALTSVVGFSRPEVTTFPVQLWLLIFTIAWIPSLLGYFLYSHALKYVEASRGSVVSIIEPVSAGVLSVIVLAETLESFQVLGIVLALIGISLLFYRPDKR